jgi:hypothetical protein
MVETSTLLGDQSRNYFYSFPFETFWTPHLAIIFVMLYRQILTSMESSNTIYNTNYVVLFRTVGYNEAITINDFNFVCEICAVSSYIHLHKFIRSVVCFL